MKKLAVIDIGSNNARMVIVNAYDNGSFRIIDELKEPVRLIADMAQDNIIRPRRIQQLIKTLIMFKRLCAANGVTEIIAVLTAAVRRAANQRSLLDEVYAATGINLTMLTGEQEAIYVYQGVINSMDIDAGVIMDIGGGTVELVHFEKRQVRNVACLPFGTLTLTEQFGTGDKVSTEQMEAIESFIKEQIDQLPWMANISNLPMIGVGGSYRNIGKVLRRKKKYSLDIAHNYYMTTDEVKSVYNGVMKMDLDSRMKIKGLSNERADIFLSALAAITTILDYINCSDVYVSCAGLREGIIYEHFDPQLAVKPVPSALEFSLRILSGLYNENDEHAQRVAQLALSMFEQLRQLHKLPNSYARIVKAAGVLHDMGQRIRYYDHHRHTFYMMLNCNLYGLNHHDRLVAAFVAQYHRKEEPKRDYIKYADIITNEDIEIINRLGVLLRIAESFDRCMSGVVTNVSCDILGDSVIIKTNASTDAVLEIKDALTSSVIFKKAYGKHLVIL